MINTTSRHRRKKMAAGGAPYEQNGMIYTPPRRTGMAVGGRASLTKGKSMTIPRSGFALGGFASRVGMAAGGNAEDLVTQAYASIGRTGFGDSVSTIDQEGFDWWVNALDTGQVSEADFNASFQGVVDDYIAQNPDDEYSQYVTNYQASAANTPVGSTTVTPATISDVTGTSTGTTGGAIGTGASGPTDNGSTVTSGTSTPAASTSTSSSSALTLTPEIAADLMQRSMTTGVPTLEMNAYGGYDAVQAMYEANNGTYSIGDFDTNTTLALAETQAGQESGNAAVQSAASVINAVRNVADADPSSDFIAEYMDKITEGDLTQAQLEQMIQDDPTLLEGNTVPIAVDYSQLVTDAYAAIGRSGFGTTADTIDEEGFNYWVNALETGQITPEEFQAAFDAAVAANNAGTVGTGTGGTGTGGTTSPSSSANIDELIQNVKTRLEGTLPEGTTLTAQKILDGMTDAEKDQLLTSYTPLNKLTDVTAQAASTEGLTIDQPLAEGQAAPTFNYTAITSLEDIPEATAAYLGTDEVNDLVKIGSIQGELSAQAQAIAAQGAVQQEQLVSYQLGQLYDSIKDGQPLPAWAAGPVRGVTQIMAKRGLGTSSMASAAMVQALQENAIPIAAADAAEYSKLNIANLNNRQQAVLQNAAAFAQMDMANLDARMKAAVTNAQNFLAIDLQNLSNEQATEVLNYQGELQALFTDVAAENAAAQFNAKSDQQVDEFYAELSVQVDNANANRSAAMAQFNVDQANSVAMFNQTIEDARDRFDSQMQVQIDQSNAAWRRTIATTDTATANEINRINAMNTLEISQSALSALWQRYRDESAWLMQSAENAVQRAHQLALLEYEKTANVEMFGLESEYQTAASVGNAGMALVLGYLDS